MVIDVLLSIIFIIIFILFVFFWNGSFPPPLFILLGTSDEHLSLLEHLAPVRERISAVIVTTPQAVALLDAMKCLSFARSVELPVLGLIENMSGYVCPCCNEVSNIFSVGGGREMARTENLSFLGSLPVDSNLVTLLDTPNLRSESEQIEEPGFGLLQRYQKTTSSELFREITKHVLERLPGQN